MTGGCEPGMSSPCRLRCQPSTEHTTTVTSNLGPEYPPIDPAEPVPDDPGELSPDTPDTLPPAPEEPMPDDPDGPEQVPAVP
jgi:hypothetical protein